MENSIVEQELQSTALTLKDQATAIVVKDLATYSAAGELGKSIKDLRAKIVDYFKPLKEAAFRAHKAVTAKEAEELKPVDEAINILRIAMNDFSREQERIRQENERKAREAAEAAAEKERQALLAKAVKAEEAGKTDKAESLLEKAEEVYTAPVTVAPTVAKTVQTEAGNITQSRETKVMVTNPVLFLKTLCENNPGAVASIVTFGANPLKNFVKSNGLETYPGLTIEKTTSVRF